jgi:hypothetical protein
MNYPDIELYIDGRRRAEHQGELGPCEAAMRGTQHQLNTCDFERLTRPVC